MKKIMVGCALAFATAGASVSVGVAAVGCSGSSKSKGGTQDSGVHDSSVAPGTDAGHDSGTTPEGSAPTEGGGMMDVVAGGGPKLLVTYGEAASILYVVDVAGKSRAGTLAFQGAFGAPFDQTAAPYLLEQQADLVARLNPTTPWTIDSSWNVALSDATDGGAPYSDPYAVVVGTPSSAYVLRYTRNEIAVINPSQNVDGGAPTATIDLSTLVQPGDSDRVVEMTAGLYVASSQTLYVVLGNIDRNLVVNSGENLLCASTVSTVVGIDTTTNTIKPLGGTGPGGAIVLTGYDPITGGVAYDSTGNRLLIAESGCNTLVDAGKGAPDSGMTAVSPIEKRGVEAVILGNSPTTMILHDGSMDGVPSEFVYIDASHAVLGFDYTGSETVQWDPTVPSLGTPIPDAPDVFVYDGTANLVGVLTTFEGDGGSTTNVVSAPVAGGAATTILANAFAMSAGCGSFCVGGLALWPAL